MPKGCRKTPVTWSCVDCGLHSVAEMTGVVPLRCPECKARRKASLQKAYRAANPEASAKHQLDYRLKAYGVGPNEYAAMVSRAAGACEACGHRGVIHIDHCHKTRTGRGMLCPACNKALGLLLDSPARCRALADYLER